MIDRRAFLRRAVQATLAGTAAAAAPHWLLRSAEASTTDRSLVCVFLRGGCDGLNVVVPHGDDEYHRQRPTIRIPSPAPGAVNAALDLNGYFGLHPALPGLHRLYRQGGLAILPAVHYPEASRSHFKSQAVIEHAGSVDGTGWLNRYLAATGGSPGLRGLALAASTPDAMKGPLQVRALNSLSASVLSQDAGEEDALVSRMGGQYARRPAGSEQVALARVRESGAMALADLKFLRDFGAGTYRPAAEYPTTLFGTQMRDCAMLIKHDLGLEVASIDFGGWDTHILQGNGAPDGRQSGQLAELDAVLTAFMADLGPASSKVAVLVMTEFGRTLAQNANGGTDHGNASAWFVLGGTTRGGIHLGAAGWPGLLPDQLREGRDLVHSIDFHNVLASILTGHFKLQPAALQSIVPPLSESYPALI